MHLTEHQMTATEIFHYLTQSSVFWLIFGLCMGGVGLMMFSKATNGELMQLAISLGMLIVVPTVLFTATFILSNLMASQNDLFDFKKYQLSGETTVQSDQNQKTNSKLTKSTKNKYQIIVDGKKCYIQFPSDEVINDKDTIKIKDKTIMKPDKDLDFNLKKKDYTIKKS